MLPAASVAFIEEGHCLDNESTLEFAPIERKETHEDLKISPDLSNEQKEQVREVLEEFSDILSDIPGRVKDYEHEIKVTDHRPFRTKQYPIPLHAREAV